LDVATAFLARSKFLAELGFSLKIRTSIIIKFKNSLNSIVKTQKFNND
jgi:hypothetical protein